MEKRLLKKPYILLETSTSKQNKHTQSIEFLNKKASKMNLCAENRNRYKLLSNFMPYMHTRTHAHRQQKKRISWQKYRAKKIVWNLHSPLVCWDVSCVFLFFVFRFRFYGTKCVERKCSCQSIYKLFIIWNFRSTCAHVIQTGHYFTLAAFFSSFELCSFFFLSPEYEPESVLKYILSNNNTSMNVPVR